jgi:hypothetical protein
MEEVFYPLVSKVLCLQFHDVFVFIYHHISSGWWLEEAMVYGIWATLDAHTNWVVLQVDIANAFNVISCKAIFQKLWVTKG